MADTRPKPLLNKRRAARFAAVQALYQIELRDQPPASVMAEFSTHRLAHLLEPLDPEIDQPKVDRPWFELLVKGAWEARERLDPQIEACLAPGWTLGRCGYLSRATLRAGAFELAERADVPLKVIINEYVELAHLFLTEAEPAFINAVLDRLGQHLRQPPDSA